MITFKQLEALYWVARLGGFSQAALKLNTTQSAVSKRIQEMERLFDTELFDRSYRTARLTEKGEAMLTTAKRLLEQRDLAMEEFSRPDIISRRLRIGVTELTAMTWLPRLVQLIRNNYPKVLIEPVVDMTIRLKERLMGDQVDLIIVPAAFSEPSLSSREVGQVESAWMAAPGLVPTHRTLRLHELAPYTIITQGSMSGTGLIYDRWLRSQSMPVSNAISSNSLLPLIGMTIARLGISYMPIEPLSDIIQRGLLEIVKTTPALPIVSYAAMYPTERKSPLVASVVMLAQDACDFSRMFQTV